jgi:type II secretory pathway pseudopilin PulG
MNKKLTAGKGDTLVEVLFAMAIIGLSLGIAFSLSNSAFNTGRNAQERSEALKQAESQLERLKVGIAGSDATSIDVYQDTDDYCILPGQSSGEVTEIPDLSDSSNACNGVNGGLYSIRIEYTEPVATPETPELYKSIVTWDTIGSEVDSVVELNYRP